MFVFFKSCVFFTILGFILSFGCLVQNSFADDGDCEDWKVSVGIFKDSREPLLIFESCRGSVTSYYLKKLNLDKIRCNFACRALSYLFPSKFSPQLIQVVKEDAVGEMIKDGKIEIVQKWLVNEFYASTSIAKLELDSRSKYGYQGNSKNLDSWYGLGVVNSKEDRWLKWCNYGSFRGYTNSAIYIASFLDFKCNIRNFSYGFYGFSNNPNECLYECAKKHSDGLIK